MKILLVGVQDIATSTNVQMKVAFQRLGHEVIDFNYRTVAKEVGYPEMENKLVEETQVVRPDLVFLCKTNRMNPSYITRINEYSKTWYWWMDRLGSCIGSDCFEFARRATWCSATSIEVWREFSKINSKSHKIYEGFNPEIYHREDLVKNYDIVFVGSPDEKRVRIIKRLKREGLDITVFGERFGNPPVYLNDLNRVHNQSKIVLNICRRDIFSNRVFEATSSGAFVLSECCTDLLEDFPSFICFKNETECVNLAKRYLDQPDERKAVAEMNYRIIQNYSWKWQMKKVLEKVGNG